VAKYASPSAWWKFVQCQNSHGRYQVGIPDLTLQCARAANIDWEGSGVASCVGLDVSGKAEEGKELLRQSALLGKSLGIECVCFAHLCSFGTEDLSRKSCTVLINRKKVCVHDGTWQECDVSCPMRKELAAS
jgi:hypothetical protein